MLTEECNLPGIQLTWSIHEPEYVGRPDLQNQTNLSHQSQLQLELEPTKHSNQNQKRIYLLTPTTSMPLDTAALHIAEPTKPLPPNTTTYTHKNVHTQK